VGFIPLAAASGICADDYEPKPDSKLRKHMGTNLKDQNLAMMSADELWSLREKIHAILSTKMDAEKRELERRLAQLNGRNKRNKKARRPYPKVRPKYRNPERPSETWSGRGKQPRWVSAHLRSGRKVDDLLISRAH
jgi:DNA-binding protein H-NS